MPPLRAGAAMIKVRNVLIVILIVIGVLLLSYLFRNTQPPPNCEFEPANPACEQR